MSRFVVGIDLGTTNCALAAARLSGPDEAIVVEDFEVEQLERPSSLLGKASLPSFMYLPQTGELPAGSLDLPWATDRDFVVGLAARERGAQVPLRLISSAKSWLCHDGIDRRAATLPYQAPEDLNKRSAVAVSAEFLLHLREAWDRAHPEHPLVDQQVYLTVPASFDAVARELTVEAAATAGLDGCTLLEEPLAAFYAWLAKVEDGWRDILKPGDRVLVVDVGGGTCDFSLIEVTDRDGDLTLERVAVGEHILLGGDNMDLALAHLLRGKLAAAGKKIDAAQHRGLIQGARRAKESLLSNPEADAEAITVLGRGSKLIGGKLKTELTRADLEQVLLDGFFPRCALSDQPTHNAQAGLREFGLPYAQDAGITRHLAAFLGRHATGSVSHVLFNGGVFNGRVLRDRLKEILSGWGAGPVQVLDESDHDLAVSRGAAYFGGTKFGGGIRIRGGIARSYYIGIESPAPAVPGVEPPINALCVVPFGMEEGTEAAVPGTSIGLVVGQTVRFRFLSATDRPSDTVGAVLDEYTWPDLLLEGAPLEAHLPEGEHAPGTLVPVSLVAKATAIGTLELWARQSDGPGSWRLEFSLREPGEPEVLH